MGIKKLAQVGEMKCLTHTAGWSEWFSVTWMPGIESDATGRPAAPSQSAARLPPSKVSQAGSLAPHAVWDICLASTAGGRQEADRYSPACLKSALGSEKGKAPMDR